MLSSLRNTAPRHTPCDVPHSGILPPYKAGWWPDPASFCRRVSCQVADITSHVKHTTTTTTAGDE